MAYKVFVIATPKDGDLAVELTRRLEKAGIEVLSKRFQANGAIDDRLRKKLGASDEVFILLTDDSLNNERVTVLLGAALGLHKRVTAILVGVREQELPSIFEEYDASIILMLLNIFLNCRADRRKFLFEQKT
jgi:hypothetical protein